MTNSGTLFINGKFFTADKSSHGKATFLDSMYVEDGVIQEIGNHGDEVIVALKTKTSSAHDLEGQTVLPGFFDGHMHLLLLGQSLQKLDLTGSKDLEEIRSRIKQFAVTNPDLPRILVRGWMHIMTGGVVTAEMLDDIDSRPIFIDSKDLHSCWCNTPALKELEVQSTPDPAGGKIERNEHGNPTGLLSEAAILTIVWPFLSRVASMEVKMDCIKAALQTYSIAGYTGLIDMAMDEDAWEALVALSKRDTNLHMRLAVYWLIIPSHDEAGNLAQVDRAIELSKQFNEETSLDLRVVGIKVICDGVIDACTAALTQPYSTNAQTIDPLWPIEMLNPVVKRAAAAGIQCALHAIGDEAIKNAINAIAQTDSAGKRHRIEHLELASAEDSKRLADLQITASVQPVHSDPAILRAWPKLLGKERLERAFAYKEFLDNGVTLAFGSDTPGAHYAPFQNLYVATTRKSAKEPEKNEDPVNGHFAIGLCDAISAATYGAAYSCFAEKRTGSLKKGLQADFVVLDMKYDAEALLDASVKQTWYAGKKVFDARTGIL
jgi:predicted amidohydrolase YtcJ